jgi:hypothetical protein
MDDVWCVSNTSFSYSQWIATLIINSNTTQALFCFDPLLWRHFGLWRVRLCETKNSYSETDSPETGFLSWRHFGLSRVRLWITESRRIMFFLYWPNVLFSCLQYKRRKRQFRSPERQYSKSGHSGLLAHHGNLFTVNGASNVSVPNTRWCIHFPSSWNCSIGISSYPC